MNVFERQILIHSGRVLKQCYLQDTNDIEDSNSHELQSIDDFITKWIKMGSLNFLMCQSNG